jgi:transcriptional regulator with XRE-family HTH domain
VSVTLARFTSTDACHLFDERARTVLIKEGKRPTASAVAAVLGVSVSQYTAYLRGTRTSWDALLDWTERWHRAGKPPLGVLSTVSVRLGLA